ncbi:MAG: polysaccharide deacetylase family protein [Nanoarchaeota archaeon]|nr:polysaccharide deacetylase family protein [Nanoarchaeota archaeon]
MPVGYLTIDDAPTRYTKKKLDYLISKKISAILFCPGELIKKKMNIVVYTIKKGFIIGNHSYNHPYFSKISIKDAKWQIEETDKLIEEAYKKAKAKRKVKLFRFPFGDKGNGDFEEVKPKNKHAREIQKILKKLGYKNIDINLLKPLKHNKKDRDVIWTFDCLEYELPIDKVFKRIDDSPRLKAKEAIILIHDFSTPKVFRQIIEKLISKGIKFKLPKFR